MTTDVDRRTATRKILEERARVLARTGEETSSDGNVLRFLAFSVGEERFGVELNYIQEIQPLKPGMWSLAPCTPEFIVGAVNIRGRIYSIMNVVAYLEIGLSVNMEKAHVLLVRGETAPQKTLMEFCILAEDRPKLEQVLPHQVQPSSGTISDKAQEFIRGVTADMLMILDLEKLISHPGIIVNDETN